MRSPPAAERVLGAWGVLGPRRMATSLTPDPGPRVQGQRPGALGECGPALEGPQPQCRWAHRHFGVLPGEHGCLLARCQDRLLPCMSRFSTSHKSWFLSAPKSHHHEDGSEASLRRASSPTCSSMDGEVCLRARPHSAGCRCATLVCLCVELLQSSQRVELNICCVWFCII